MSIKIYSLFKEDFSHNKNVILTITNAYSMTVSHFAGCNKSSEATIPFIMEGTDKYVPRIEDVEFVVNIREKINLTATGINEQKITDVGEDVGEYNHVNSVPTRPIDLPPGFNEIYRGH